MNMKMLVLTAPNPHVTVFNGHLSSINIVRIDLQADIKWPTRNEFLRQWDLCVPKSKQQP